MEIYYGLKVDRADEILIAFLTQFEFESFEENDDHFIGYIKKSNLTDETRIEVEGLLTEHEVTFNFYEIEPQNWNEIWEASFQPVIVGNFCQVRADFHPSKDDIRYDLIINPKMAFGTGHHATTHMMIEKMADIPFNEKKVFDFGCGTGILAILASKLGADQIDALDIEYESYMNTIENASINQVKNIKAFEGDLDIIIGDNYDIILANINRNILVQNANVLVGKLAVSGKLLLSGILEEDADSVLKSYAVFGLKNQSQLSRDGWVCLLMTQ